MRVALPSQPSPVEGEEAGYGDDGSRNSTS